MVYGNPVGKYKWKLWIKPLSSFYSFSKLGSEYFLKKLSLERKFLLTILRISGIVELKKNLISIAKYKLIKGQKVEIYGGKQIVRDYIFIKDLFSLLNILIKKKMKYKKKNIFNFSSFQNRTIYSVIKKIKTILKSKSIIKIKKNKALKFVFYEYRFNKKKLRFWTSMFYRELKNFFKWKIIFIL